MLNKQVLMASRPVGAPKLSDFRLVQTELPDLKEGEVLLEVVYLSVDPYMRGRMSEGKSYAAPMQVGDVMVGGTIGRVLRSHDPNFSYGDYAEAFVGWQQYGIVPGKQLRKLDPQAGPLSAALSVMGMPGLTAYFGLLDICKPMRGETVVVSGAAGAVGSIVGQIARLKGCNVVGIAGSDDKVKWLTSELGFDSAYNYKTSPNHYEKLKDLCSKGIDCYFDNVGGAITDAVFGLLNPNARIAICGQISQYNNTEAELGPRNLSQILVKTATVRGFLVMQYLDQAREALIEMGGWLREGKLKYRETFVDGLENAPAAFLGLLRGDNTGKMLVRVSPER
ncbi:MAG: NADP-dependent oxidoreductase [Bryobacteraceae bacterium]|nr:NADP-dependent oxidoreductase [Bryobacteraceae bacterium]